jgi:hypothetical protein
MPFSPAICPGGKYTNESRAYEQYARNSVPTIHCQAGPYFASTCSCGVGDEPDQRGCTQDARTKRVADATPCVCHQPLSSTTAGSGYESRNADAINAARVAGELAFTSRDSTEHVAPSLSAKTFLMILTMSLSMVLPFAEYSSTSTTMPVGPVLALPVTDMEAVKYAGQRGASERWRILARGHSAVAELPGINIARRFTVLRCGYTCTSRTRALEYYVRTRTRVRPGVLASTRTCTMVRTRAILPRYPRVPWY